LMLCGHRDVLDLGWIVAMIAASGGSHNGKRMSG
jgi:hypothetical protein